MSRYCFALLLTLVCVGSLVAEEVSPAAADAGSGETVLMDRKDLDAMLAEMEAIRQENQAMKAELQLFRTPPAEDSQPIIRNASIVTETAMVETSGEHVAEQCYPLADCRYPGWTARVGYVQLWRETTGSDAPVLASGNPANAINDSDLDFSSASIIDASLCWDSGCGDAIELRYLGLAEYSFGRRINGVQYNLATTPVTPSPPSFFGFDVSYMSQFQSVELMGWPCNWPGLSYGLRYVDLQEDLMIIEPGNAEANFCSQNRLFGFQVGVERTLWDHWHGLRIDGSLKAGAYYNDVQATARAFQAPTLLGSGQARDVELAFVGECSMLADYAVNDCWSLRAGGQLLFLDGVALATDQVSSTGNLSAAGSTLVPVRIDSSSVVYLGIHLGVERCW